MKKVRKLVFRIAAAAVAVAPLPCMGQEEPDIAREKTLQEVTVTSRSAQKRVDEVQIGVEKVEIHKSNSSRENRYSIMIEMTLTPEGLEHFDASEVHHRWKDLYGSRLESKATSWASLMVHTIDTIKAAATM